MVRLVTLKPWRRLSRFSGIEHVVTLTLLILFYVKETLTYLTTRLEALERSRLNHGQVIFVRLAALTNLTVT